MSRAPRAVGARAVRQTATRLHVLAGLLLGARAVAAHAEAVPAEYRGDWVPTTANCASPLRLRMTAAEAVLINGQDQAAYGHIGWPSGYFGEAYSGITVVGIPELDGGNAPFTIFFNAGEKKDVAKLGILQGQEVAGSGKAQYNQIVRAAQQLNRRFPLDDVPLRKCAAAAADGAPLRNIAGDSFYLGRGVAELPQRGAAVHLHMARTPLAGGPHHGAKGLPGGDTIVGERYSLRTVLGKNH